MDVSLIIPVYNAAKWIESSILSAVEHDSIKEILVVDDGSKDDSLTIITRLSLEYSQIKIFKHHENQNRGRSASRNLAISNAQCEWIAFLDSDDLYLKNRFDGIRLREDIDGYYGITESVFENPSLGYEEVTGLPIGINSDALFDYLTTHSSERFSIITLTVKRSAVLNIGGFDENLSIGEDTDFIWRLAYRFSLTHQNIEVPIAQRRIHANNSHFSPQDQHQFRFLFYSKWLKRKNLLSQPAYRRIYNAYISYHPRKDNYIWLLWKKLSYLIR